MTDKRKTKDVGEGPWDATSWDELKEQASLNDVTKALRAQEVNRLAHKRYNLKKQALLERARQLEAEGKLQLS